MARCQWGKVLLVVGLAVWSSAFLFTQDAHAAGFDFEITVSLNPIPVGGYGAITFTVLEGTVTTCSYESGPWVAWPAPIWANNPITWGTYIWATDTWSLKCSDGVNTVTRSVLWKVDTPPPPTPLPPAAPTLTLNAVAGDITITLGDTVTIVWDSPTADGCTASSTDGSWSGPVVPSGTANVTPASLPQTYSVFCSNAGGNSPTTSRKVSAVPPPPPPPPAPTLTVNGFASDIQITLGDSVTIVWNSPTATGCTASGTGWSGNKGTSGIETVTPASLPLTYSLTCSNAGGNSPTTKRTVSELPPATPMINKAGFLLPAEPPTALPGDRTVAHGSIYSYLWETTNADKVVWDCVGDWTGSDPGAPANQPRTDNNSNTLVGPAGGVTTCTYTPYKGSVAGASVTRILTITAVPVPAPVITLTVAPGSIPVGDPATLSWSVTDAVGCDASSTDTLWSGPKNFVGGSDTVSPASNTSYTLTCWNATDTVSKTVTLIVTGGCDNSCAAITCTTATCKNSCGVDIPGLKDCTPPPPPPPAPSGDSPSLIPCGRNIDDLGTPGINETDPCTVCHIVVGGQRLITWGLKIMVIIAVTVLFAMAVLYVVSAGDQGLMQTAKGGIWAVLIGFGVMLSAWLMVNTVLSILADTTTVGKPLEGLVKNGTFSFTCETKSKVSQSGWSGGGAGGGGGGPAVCPGVDPVALKGSLQLGASVCSGPCKKGKCTFTPAIETAIVANNDGVDTRIIKAIICQESTANPNAHNSSDGGCGLMQITNPAWIPGCPAFILDPAENIRQGVALYKAKLAAVGGYSYGNGINAQHLTFASYNCCLGGDNPNAQSVSCAVGDGWPALPKWACPIDPGPGTYNMCAVKNYACDVEACIGQYT